MLKFLTVSILLIGFGQILSNCNNATEVKGAISENTNLKISATTIETEDSLTDPRDGQTYPTVKIGKQIWMAENLRYDAPGSMLHVDHPSPTYGRLYNGISAQTACPEGWHLPSDSEWNEMEMALGMPPKDTATIDWRGEHGVMLKSTTSWADGKNGTNSSGFNGLAAGYYFPAFNGGEADMGGVGQSGGFWSAVAPYSEPTRKAGNKAWVRFLGAPLAGVNRFVDDIYSGSSLACRCIKN